MNNQSKELADRLKNFNDEVALFVEKCSDADWKKICTWEQWPVGVTARHIADGHYQAVGLSSKIIAGEELPEMSREQIVEMANQHARDHAGCKKEEVLDLLGRNGRKMVEFVAGLLDTELDKKGRLSMMGEISVRQLIESVVLQSGKEHFDNMKAAVGR